MVCRAKQGATTRFCRVSVHREKPIARYGMQRNPGIRKPARPGQEARGSDCLNELVLAVIGGDGADESRSRANRT